jgi:ribonucleoside-diphosphate reductase alpha chain
MKKRDPESGKMVVVERPQHLYMRVAIGIHKNDIESALKTYELISQHFYTHASPTLFNSGTKLANMASCFLIGTGDHIEGIFKTITDCAYISKVGGGIGVHVSNIRAEGSVIRGTNGISDGIIPMLKVYNNTSTWINQSGRRKGSFAMYLEPWHADISEFLDLKKNQGHDDVRARDLFYAIWMPDLFMKTVEQDGNWYLMCPDECPGLTDCYGKDFEDLYNRYVEEKRYKRVVKAQEIWRKIMDSQIETGVPYIGYKDAVNKKCNQKNLGTIKSSNLCAEISLYSDHKSYAVCNLCSIALPKYVKQTPDGPVFDFDHLKQVAEHVVLALNCVIDNTYYPTPETRETNFKHRPLGIGVQGLADVYMMMRMPFESAEAKQLNKEIFETLYYGTISGSIKEAQKYGKYESFENSPFSKGLLQFDLAKEFDNVDLNQYISGRWDWDALKAQIKEHGIRNSMLTALMPTASTAQIMGNSECFEPIDSCIFKRRVLSGEYLVVNKHLVADLIKLGLWSKEMKDTIIAQNGSIANIPEIPQNIKDIYKNVWEISMKSVIEQARDRGVFVDQMQSMNLFMSNPNYKKLTSMHFYAWKKGLKTGIYYLRSKSSSSAGKFSVDPELEKKLRDKVEAGESLAREEEKLLCSIDNKEECMMCSS